MPLLHFPCELATWSHIQAHMHPCQPSSPTHPSHMQSVGRASQNATCPSFVTASDVCSDTSVTLGLTASTAWSLTCDETSGTCTATALVRSRLPACDCLPRVPPPLGTALRGACLPVENRSRQADRGGVSEDPQHSPRLHGNSGSSSSRSSAPAAKQSPTGPLCLRPAPALQSRAACANGKIFFGFSNDCAVTKASLYSKGDNATGAAIIASVAQASVPLPPPPPPSPSPSPPPTMSPPPKRSPPLNKPPPSPSPPLQKPPPSPTAMSPPPSPRKMPPPSPMPPSSKPPPPPPSVLASPPPKRSPPPPLLLASPPLSPPLPRPPR